MLVRLSSLLASFYISSLLLFFSYETATKIFMQVLFKYGLHLGVMLLSNTIKIAEIFEQFESLDIFCLYCW
jgi:hypothetical protein